MPRECYGGDTMNQKERRMYLINALLKEQPLFSRVHVPRGEMDQRNLLRSIMNLRPAGEAAPEILKVQDEYLQEEIRKKGVTDIADLKPVADRIYLWQGDITTLRCDAIVNAANRGLTGCYFPLHSCIDNCIHTYAGIQLRQECAAIMAKQGKEEAVGKAKITSAYNLPCRYVIHTVGPVVIGQLTSEDKKQLASCYRSCLKLAEKKGVKSLAFCCISTGEFQFPYEKAAEIAVRTVKRYLAGNDRDIKIIFNVYLDRDREIYEKLLGVS